ncbi:MAG: glycosyltransferase family 2 protein [Fusobacteriaceae bacterium]
MKVSIITASYNSDKYIEDTIKSVLSQTYKDIEYIIIDGGSKDKTIDIIKKYEAQFNGKLKWVSEKDKGIYDAMNKGINLSTGDIVGLINSDDYLADENVIKKIVQKISEEKADLIYGDLDFIKENEKNTIVRKWKSGIYKKGIFKRGWHPAHPTLYLTKDFYKKIGNFSLDYKIAADFDLMLRMFEKNNPKVAYLEEVMVKMRVGGVSTGGFKSKVIIAKECSKAWKKNNLSKPLFFDYIRFITKLKQMI